MFKILPTLLIAILFTCTACAKQTDLTQAERTLSATTGVPASLALEMTQLGKNLRRLQGTNDNGDVVDAAGITFDVPQEKASAAVDRLRKIAGHGFFICISERHFGYDGAPDNVSVLKASDPYEMLRVMGTNGTNYDISTDQVINRIKQWDKKFGVTLKGVGFDWVEMEFKQQPADMMAFAQEVYKFCPDVVDQGTGNVQVLAKEMKDSNTVYLWWD